MRALEVKVEKVRESGSIELRSVFFKSAEKAREFISYAKGNSFIKNKVSSVLIRLYPDNSKTSAWEVGYCNL